MVSLLYWMLLLRTMHDDIILLSQSTLKDVMDDRSLLGNNQCRNMVKNCTDENHFRCSTTRRTADDNEEHTEIISTFDGSIIPIWLFQ